MAKSVRCFLFFVPLFFTFFCFAEPDAQTGSDVLNRIYNQQTIRHPVWVFYAPPPDIKATEWAKPRVRLHEAARYLMEASVFGWDVRYTPYDRARGVTEEFEASPVFKLPLDAVSVEDIELKGDKLHGVAVYVMKPDRAQWYNQWSNVRYRTFAGTGEGNVTATGEGLAHAVENAVKEAVRTYGRSIEKNKPKEIHAMVRLAGNPRILLKAGVYYADVRVRIYITEVVPYSVF